ncbi:MAG: hypothetical protein RMJ98_21340, partial [Myxococcales bacterium]|nr:hypothetical protein [Polyangiaceae bacterium]MDW8251849.1 hypothetical protein [Myxococcales bacterium]
KYAILVGMTPLIPLPFLDDIAQSYFEQRMIERLARAHRLSLTPAQIDDLSVQPDPSGCVKGCLLNLLLYPLKKILRKLFFFLEIKRTVDLVATTYAKGYVLDRVLARGLCAPAGPHSPAQVRGATERALARVGTSPIELAVRHAFSSSTRLLRNLVDQLFAALHRLTRGSNREQIAEAARSVEEQPSQEFIQVKAQVQEGLRGVPAAHFEKLESATVEELGQMGSP